jgi:ascorbate-specific PTS system EIIC-type component UlaA
MAVHPATLLTAWVVFALALQAVSVGFAGGFAVGFAALALLFARRRTLGLVRRTRWLLLSIGLLFIFFTPGEYLPGFAGVLGMSREGLQLAAEHLSRLLAMLTSLALLHERLGTQGLLAGFYWLMRPFGWRDATVVRLMLVLEYAERQEARKGWRYWLAADGDDSGTESLRLESPAMSVVDRLLIGAMSAGVLAGMVWL